jgi:outer membrane immunogenic protein
MQKMLSGMLLGMRVVAVSSVMFGGAVQAADLPRKAPPPAPAPVMYNWTGFYIGAHVGGAFRDRKGDHRFDNECLTVAAGLLCFEGSHNGDNDGSFLAGGQIGFNYQVGTIVWGVEGQASWVDHDDEHDCGFFTLNGVRDNLFRCRHGGDWVATIAARLGVAVGPTGNWLLYVKGGGAFADAGFGMRLRNDCLICDPSDPAFFGDNDDTRTGWMVGAGVEYGAWGNWSWKLEYNFLDFGGDDDRFNNFLTACACFLGHHFDRDDRVHIVKFGLNYRFGAAAAPVAARY